MQWTGNAEAGTNRIACDMDAPADPRGNRTGLLQHSDVQPSMSTPFAVYVRALNLTNARFGAVALSKYSVGTRNFSGASSR